MPFTRTTFIRILKIGSAVLIILVIIAYALWRSLAYARGPHINIIEPVDGASISASTTVIRGNVERANNITLNGRTVTIDELGNFSEIIIVFPGINIITLDAKDQFERMVETQLRLFRK
ncbi:MAG: hypothetical protein RL536_534 [Candidatus Parcubacteria bacterium]|jgi:hypothetical protein